MLKRTIWTGAIAILIFLAVVLCTVLAFKVQNPSVVNETNKDSSVAPWITEPTNNFPPSIINAPNATVYPNSFTQSHNITPRPTTSNWDTAFGDLKNKLSKDFFILPQLNEDEFERIKTKTKKQAIHQARKNIENIQKDGFNFFGVTLRAEENTLPDMVLKLKEQISNSLDILLERLKELKRRQTTIDLDNSPFNETLVKQTYEKFKAIIKASNYYNSKITGSEKDLIQHNENYSRLIIKAKEKEKRLQAVWKNISYSDLIKSRLVEIKDFYFTKEDYTNLIKLLTLESSSERLFLFTNCEFESEGAWEIDANVLSSVKSFLFFENCQMNPITKLLFMDNSNAPERITFFYQANNENYSAIKSQ